MLADTGGNEPVTRNPTEMELRADREIVVTRVFDAPPRLVFEACTKPEPVRRWRAPKSHNVASGMEHGSREAMKQLEDLVCPQI